LKLSDLSEHVLATRLRGEGLPIRIPPIVVRVRSDIPSVACGLALHYGDNAVEPEDGFADFHVAVVRPRSYRRWLRSQAVFQFDNQQPFKPLPLDQAFPMLEWGLNWCVANHCHQYLMVHAGVIERAGRAALLAAPPGSGKSTLCAGLVNRGWRLLSDELALIGLSDGLITPITRPVSLKNDSIPVIRSFAPEAFIGPTAHDTRKGTVAHMRPPADSIRRAAEKARPAWVVFPSYEPGSAARAEPLSAARAAIKLIDNAFNYSLLGAVGFDAINRMAGACQCFRFVYSRLEDADEVFARLASCPEP
jgi:hypothetical protein